VAAGINTKLADALSINGILQFYLKLVKVVAQKHIAVALKKSVHARCHHFPRTWLDSGEMKTSET
jgi:hypothetical protein